MLGGSFSLLLVVALLLIVVIGNKRVMQEKDFVSGILQASTALIFVLDQRGYLLRCNPALIRLTGCEEDDLTETHLLAAKIFPDREAAKKHFIDTWPEPKTSRDFELKIKNRNGELFHVSWSVTTLVRPEHRDKLLICTGIDITERKQAVLALAEEKERLAVTIASLHEGVLTTDMQGRIMLFNHSAELITEKKYDDVKGKPIEEVIQLHTRQKGTPITNLLTALQKQEGDTSPDMQAVLTDGKGEEKLIEGNASAIRDSAGNTIGHVVILRDISEREHLEQELLKATKLESLGVLAGGIAHDFNNILTAIIGNLSLAKSCIHDANELYDIIEDIEAASTRAKGLTAQLRTFAKGGAPVRKTASIGELVEEVCSFSLRGSNVRASISIQPDLHNVEIDTGQIHQVINNLVINAMQAMPDGGMIEISCVNLTLSEPNSFSLPAGNYVSLRITDQGHGIAPDHLSRIFDPYFTTKQTGSGLGLATSYSIIKKHDGHIVCKSELGKGTTFTIYLPASKRKLQTKSRHEDILKTGSGSLLIMDDEEIIRKIIAKMVRKLGYHSVVVKDGYEAVAAYKNAREKGTPFDAVILDMTIPGSMGGKETMRQLREYDPNIKAIVSSGYHNDPILAEHEKYGFVAVVPKPYKINDLSQVLHEVIHGKNSRAENEST